MSLSYLNNEGNTVFTSEYHRKKGSCCKSSCLHCPFGYTLKNPGIVIEELNPSNEIEAKEIYDVCFPQDNLSSSLLASAFKKKPLVEFNATNFKVITLKSHVCGLIEFADSEFKKLYLKDEFSDQGISEGYVLGKLG